MHGQEGVVALLLAHGANMTLSSASPWYNNNGRTALHWACYYGHTPVVAQLCAHAASADGGHAWMQVKDRMGRTPLHWAARKGNAACAGVLLYHGVDVIAGVKWQDVGKDAAAASVRSDALSAKLADALQRQRVFSLEELRKLEVDAADLSLSLNQAFKVGDRHMRPLAVEDTDRKGASALKLAQMHKHKACAALLERVHAENRRPDHLPVAAHLQLNPPHSGLATASGNHLVSGAVATGSHRDSPTRTGKQGATVDVFLTRTGTLGKALTGAAGLLPLQDETAAKADRAHADPHVQQEAMRAAVQKLQSQILKNRAASSGGAPRHASSSPTKAKDSPPTAVSLKSLLSSRMALSRAHTLTHTQSLAHSISTATPHSSATVPMCLRV